MIFKWMFGGLLFAAGFISCIKENEDVTPPADPQAKGVFILNEGAYGSNNSGISFYDPVTGSVSFDILGQTAGDTGQDMMIYGNNLYVVFSVSGYISVIRTDTKQEIRKILIQDVQQQSRNPRYLDAHDGKVFVSTFDGHLLRIDTLTLSVDREVTTGPNPEGILYHNGKVYVANSDGLNSDNGCVNGKSVSVINAATFVKEKDIPVRANPYYLQADAQGNIYVSIRSIWKMEADYSFTALAPAAFQKIDAATNDTTTISDLSILKFCIDGNNCYYFTGSGVGVLDLTTRSTRDFITDGTAIKTPYALGFDSVRRKIYVSDTDYLNPGIIYIFDMFGKKEGNFEAGVNPCDFAFYY